MAGHFKDELWGLAENPTKREVASVGDDGLLRVWDITTHSLRSSSKNSLNLGGMARAVCFSPDGALIAVGFGGSVGKGRQKNDGEIAMCVLEKRELLLIPPLSPRSDAHSAATLTPLLRTRRYDAVTLEQVFKAKDSKQWIQDLKFSPDGGTLAVGSHDNAVYFYDKKKKWKLRSKFSSHSSYITHLDFSEDSQFLRSNCGAYELLFSDVFTGKQIKSARSLRNTDWHSGSCVLGWSVQGIWSEGQGGSDINAAVRSKAGGVLVTSDDSGKVKLFSYVREHMCG